MDSDRITVEDIEALVENVPDSLLLTAEFRAQFRAYSYWRAKRKQAAGTRPPNTAGEEC